MEVIVSIKSGKEWVKRGMMATMGVTPLNDSEKFDSMIKNELSDSVFQSLLLGRHSPIEEYEIWVDAIVPERVHTHVVRHKELGKYVHSSRPDISYARPLKDGERLLSLRINAKRLIEISWVRLCKRAWKETTDLFEAIEKELSIIEPVLERFLKPSCVWFGFCTEPPLSENKCVYFNTDKCKNEREDLVYISRGSV